MGDAGNMWSCSENFDSHCQKLFTTIKTCNKPRGPTDFKSRAISNFDIESQACLSFISPEKSKSTLNYKYFISLYHYYKDVSFSFIFFCLLSFYNDFWETKKTPLRLIGETPQDTDSTIWLTLFNSQLWWDSARIFVPEGKYEYNCKKK